MNNPLQQSIQLADGRVLGYAEYGDPKGKPIFFFPGWPCSRYHAAITDKDAKTLGLRVLSVDRPGYGLSQFKKDRTLLEFPNDIIELADILKIIKFSVLGVSGGGPYAAVCSYSIPERIHKVGIVVGLSPITLQLLEGTSFLAKFCWSNYHNFPLLRRTGSIFQYIISTYSPGLGIHRFLWGAKTDKKIYDEKQVRQAAQENYKEAFRQGYKGPELDLKLYTDDWGFKVNAIKIPVYLWYGAEDKNVSIKMGEYYHKQIKKSFLTIYPDEGHLISRTHIAEILKEFV